MAELEPQAARAAELEVKLQSAEAKTERVATLEAELADARRQAERVGELEALQAELTAKVAELEAASTGGGGQSDDDDGPPEPVTEDDLFQAKRLAHALLEDVFTDDEEKTNQAIADGKFREVFAEQLERARRNHVKRVKAHVRAERDFWEEILSEFEKKTW